MQQVEQARAGIDALSESQEKIGNLRGNFELIDRSVSVYSKMLLCVVTVG